MLYDLLPPLLFFVSLGGIVVILSRIVGRLRRAELTHSLNSAAIQNEPHFNTHLQPDHARISLVTNRGRMVQSWLGEAVRTVGRGVKRAGMWLVHLFQHPVVRDSVRRAGQTLKQSPAAMRQVVASRVASRRRLGRRSTIVDRLNASSVVSETQPVASTPTLENEPAPMRDETLVADTEAADDSAPSAETETEATPPSKHVFSPAFFKKTPRPTALQQAQTAFEAEEYMHVEEILVPYIFKHANDMAAYMLLGRCALNRQNWEEAIEIFEQVVGRHPGYEGAFAALGYAAYRAGRFTRALQALQRAHDIDPADEKVLEYLLDIAHKMDNRALQHSVKEKLVALKSKARARVG